MNKLVKILAFVLLALPSGIVLAQTASAQPIVNLVNTFGNIVRSLVPILISLAVVWFIYNVIRYVIAHDEDKKSEAKQQMIWGIIGLAVIVSMWGLVAFLQNTFGINAQTGISNVTPINNLVP